MYFEITRKLIHILLISTLSFSMISCQSNTKIFLSSQDIESEYVFIITASEDLKELNILNSTARVHSSDEEPLFRFRLEEDSARIIMIGIEPGVLQEKFPSFDPSDPEQIRLLNNENIPSQQQGVIYTEFTELARAYQLDQATSVLEEVSDATLKTISQQLSLAVPQDADRCRNEAQEAFSYIKPSTTNNECNLPNYNYVQAIDETRFVAASTKRLHLYDLSTPRTCDEFLALTSSVSLRFPDSKFMAVGQTPLPDYREPNFLVASTTEEYASDEDRRQIIPSGFLLRLSKISPQGFTSNTTSHHINVDQIISQITEQCPRARTPGNPRLIEMTIDHTNRVSLAMSNGAIVYLDYNQLEFGFAIICDFSQYAIDWLLEVSHINSAPTNNDNYFVGTDNKEGFAYSLTIPSNSSNEKQFYVKPTQEIEIRASYYDTYLSPPRFIAVGEGQFSSEAAVQDRALVLKQDLDNEEFVPIVSHFPKRAESCLTNGYFTQIQKIEGNEKAYFLVPKCNTVVRMRRQDRCSMLLQPPDFQGSFTSDEPKFRDIAILNNILVAVGDDGLVASMSLTDIDKL